VPIFTKLTTAKQHYVEISYEISPKGDNKHRKHTQKSLFVLKYNMTVRVLKITKLTAPPPPPTALQPVFKSWPPQFKTHSYFIHFLDTSRTEFYQNWTKNVENRAADY
jgi:hypothetical protein